MLAMAWRPLWGAMRECSLLDVKLTLLSHNLVRGAAGAALLNAELLAVRGYLQHAGQRASISGRA